MKKKFLSIIACLLPLFVSAQTIVEDLQFNGQQVPIKLMIYTVKDPAPTVLISHSSGCGMLHVGRWAERIESWGFNAVVIDHCIKRDVKSHPAQELPKNLQVEDRIKDYVAVADWVKKQPFNKGKVGLIGFSRGGEGVLGMLNEPYYAGKAGLAEGYGKVIDAAVAYYPSCLIGDRELREPPIPLLVNIGELDALTPAVNCAFYKDYLAGKNT